MAATGWARLGAQVERAVNEVLMGERDVGLDGAWVAEVEARAGGWMQVTVTVPHRDLEGALGALERARGRLRAALAAEIGGKRIPDLRFRVVTQ